MSFFGYGTQQQEILNAIEIIESDPRKAAALVAEVLAYLTSAALERN